jgi:metallophosphoesterase superfamily enzyme
MSELKVDKVSPRTGNYVSLNTVGMKNIIINGDMSHCTKKHK